jgi:hypothetical protein
MYSSDIIDKEWLILAPFIAQDKASRQSSYQLALIYTVI